MSLVVIKYLGNETRTGINQVEEWYLPTDAYATKFYDDQGRRLYLVGTEDQVLGEGSLLSQNSVVNYHGYDFATTDVVVEVPVVVAPVVVPPVVEAPVEVPVVADPVVEAPVAPVADPTVTP